MTDPNFIYVLFIQLTVFLLVSTAAAYFVYKSYNRIVPKLNRVYRVLLTLVTLVMLISLIGVLSELIGL